MRRKHLFRGIAMVLTASTLATAFPAMTMAADETVIAADINQEADAAADQAAAPETAPEETPAETPAEALPVNVKGDAKPIADGSADKNHPIYTENVTIENGTLAEDFSENDIELSGVFNRAEIQSLSVNEDRTGFTLVFTKEYVETTRYFEGEMIVKGRAVRNASGESSQNDFSVFLYDAYRPAKEETATTDENMADKEFENILMKITNTALDIAMTGFFKNFAADYAGNLSALSGDLGMRWNAAEADSALKASEEELRAIAAMSAQLNLATKNILDAAAQNNLQSLANIINGKVEAVKSDYRVYLDTMNGLYEEAQTGSFTKGRAYVNGRMEAVYKYGNGNPKSAVAEKANFECYDNLYNLGQMMLGEGLFGSADIFQINKGLAAQKYNYNTMSFADRRARNEEFVNFYMQGYGAMITAMNYDIAKNTTLRDEYTKELEELQKLSEKKLSDSAKKKLDEKIDSTNSALNNAKDAIRLSQDRYDLLVKQKNALIDAKNNNNDLIDKEEAQPYVICNCNGEKYDKNLTVYASTPENFPVKGSFAASDVHNFVNFSHTCVGTMGGSSSSSSWATKAEWNGKLDKDCSGSGAEAFKNSIVYNANETNNLNYLADIAHKKGHTLAEELGEAFQYQGKPAAEALAAGTVDGYYNGGHFSTDEKPFKNRYCYEKTVFYFFHNFTEATYFDYNWLNIHHTVNFIDAKGDDRSNVETRKFALTAQKNHQGISVPSEDQLHKEEEFEGKSVNLFLVNFFEPDANA